MLRFIRNTLHPARYHGRLRGQQPPFFEGWYFKAVDATERHRFAFIPAIFWSERESNRSHAFIQVLDGAATTAHYHEYPVEAFWAAEDRFEVRVGASRFSQNEMTLLIDRSEQQVVGTLRLGGLTPWPVTLTSPGIMGWYGWVPVMECYHGVVSLDHAIDGELTIDGRTIDFSGGRGYIEKDWGRSFPEAYIWFQTNHFDAPGMSLTASIAIIPWRRSAFAGFIIGLWHDGRLHRFATYTGAKTERLEVTDETVSWIVGDRSYRLEMTVTQGAGRGFGLLKGPDGAEMGKRIRETLSATVHVRLSERGGRVLFEGTGRNAGLEVYEVEARLLGMVKQGR